MAYEIINIPLSSGSKTFNTDDINKFCANKKIIERKIVFFQQDGSAFWSVFIGLPFLGVRIFPSTIRIKRENFKKSFARLKLREKEYTQGAIDYERYSASMMSLISHLTHWNSRELLKKEMLDVV